MNGASRLLMGRTQVTSMSPTTADGTQRLDSLESNRFYVGKNAFDETLAILEPGRYQIEYRVTNTYANRSPITIQEIVIAEDTAPIIEGVIADSVERGSEEDGHQPQSLLQI